MPAQDIVRDSGTSLVSMKALNETFGSEKEAWRQALENELNSMTENEVFSRLTLAEVGQARPRDILPMKVVAGVDCGNFEQHGEGEPVHASNLEACSLRSALAVASARRRDISAMDVSTAFFSAHLPIEHMVLVRPPALMVRYGLVRPGEVRRATRAIYGLRVSPGSTADGAVWSIVDSAGSVFGYVLTCVGDFLILDLRGVRYLCIDIEVKIDSTMPLPQHSYTEELLEKWGTPEFGMDEPLPLDSYADASFVGIGAYTGLHAEVNALAVGENMSAAAAATLESMGLRVRPTLRGDSDAANHVAEGRRSWRTRALSTKVNAILSRMAHGLLELHFVGTTEQCADGLTKCGGVQHAARIWQHFGLRALA
ncbi:unnamed protein product [Prorocentrum cordatum]|uniref:DNA-directed DNA polymerase n=1 Tax=Prorocentrum cordatum TaxID=2364126 RepID=A0ABN9RGV9_9DINO|nr:unnamed protein product [Polarella glacialis]